jgi:predicted nuclease of predicted toxin-antitoxin system
MNFLVDAHLPRRLARRLQEAGHNVLHTLDLPAGNRTTDAEINLLSLRESRVVITKDADFVNSFLLSGRPYKLLVVSTGNITNVDLEALFVPNIPAIVAALQTNSYIELTRTTLIRHYRKVFISWQRYRSSPALIGVYAESYALRTLSP